MCLEAKGWVEGGIEIESLKKFKRGYYWMLPMLMLETELQHAKNPSQ